MAKKSGIYRHGLFRRGDIRSVSQIRPHSAAKKMANDRDEIVNEVKSSDSLNVIRTTPLMHSNDKGNTLQTNPATLMSPHLLRSISLEIVEPGAERNEIVCSSEDVRGVMPFVGAPIYVASLGQNHTICSAVPSDVCFDLFDDMEGINFCTCNGCGCCFI